MADYDYLFDCFRRYREATIDRTFSSADTMTIQADSSGRALAVAEDVYLDIGKSAIHNVFAALCASWVHRVRRVLDLPCGHGRVLRHLVKMFPEAAFDACDIDSDGVRFCAETFGANPIQSKEDLTELDLPGDYDLIWVGSLFTHTSREMTRSWLRHLTGFLAPYGIIVATFHGRWSKTAHEILNYISPSSWSKILEEYHRTGYGYADYTDEYPGAGETAYGVSLARPSTLVHELEQLPGVRLFFYRERGWADHQDVAVIGKPAYDHPWPGM